MNIVRLFLSIYRQTLNALIVVGWLVRLLLNAMPSLDFSPAEMVGVEFLEKKNKNNKPRVIKSFQFNAASFMIRIRLQIAAMMCILD